MCWSLCLTRADVRSSYQCRAQMHCEQELKLSSVSVEWRDEVAIVAIRYITHYLLSCTSFEKRSCWIYSLLVYNVHFRHLSSYPKIRLSPSTFLYGFQAILLLSSVLFFWPKFQLQSLANYLLTKRKKCSWQLHSSFSAWVPHSNEFLAVCKINVIVPQQLWTLKSWRSLFKLCKAWISETVAWNHCQRLFLRIYYIISFYRSVWNIFCW